MNLLISVGIIHLIALISPGPDFALIARISIQYSRTAAIITALGTSTAVLIHSVLSLSGISLVIREIPMLYVLLALSGASYFFINGFFLLKGFLYNVFLHRRQKINDESLSIDLNVTLNNGTSVSSKRLFLKGMLTNLLNPKVLIFFLSLLTMLVKPEHSAFIRVVLCIQIFVLCLMWFVFIAVVLSKPRIQRKLRSAQNLINGITGAVFIGFSIVIFMLIDFNAFYDFLNYFH